MHLKFGGSKTLCLLISYPLVNKEFDRENSQFLYNGN